MIQREDLLWCGVISGVIGCLVGGMLFGIGMNLVLGGQPFGWLFLLPAAPVSAIPGWFLAQRLARQL
jgi:hypothetical protein